MLAYRSHLQKPLMHLKNRLMGRSFGARRSVSVLAGCALLLAKIHVVVSQLLAGHDEVLVVSVGTTTRAALQHAQSRTFGKHLETW